MPPATLRALEGFARQGVQVFATRRTPALAPGYLATAADHAEVAARRNGCSGARRRPACSSSATPTSRRR